MSESPTELEKLSLAFDRAAAHVRAKTISTEQADAVAEELRRFAQLIIAASKLSSNGDVWIHSRVYEETADRVLSEIGLITEDQR